MNFWSGTTAGWNLVSFWIGRSTLNARFEFQMQPIYPRVNVIHFVSNFKARALRCVNHARNRVVGVDSAQSFRRTLVERRRAPLRLD